MFFLLFGLLFLWGIRNWTNWVVPIILLNMDWTEIKGAPFIRPLVHDGSSNLLDEISWETPHLLLFYCILCIWNEDNDELRHYEWDQDLERAQNVAKINGWSNGIPCPQKTYREMKQSLRDFESLTRDTWRLRPAESFYLMNSQNMLKIIWRQGLCLSGLLPFSTYFQLKVLMSTEPKGKKKKNYMPCGKGRWLHYYGGTCIFLSCQQSSWAPRTCSE